MSDTTKTARLLDMRYPPSFVDGQVYQIVGRSDFTGGSEARRTGRRPALLFLRYRVTFCSPRRLMGQGWIVFGPKPEFDRRSLEMVLRARGGVPRTGAGPYVRSLTT